MDFKSELLKLFVTQIAPVLATILGTVLVAAGGVLVAWLNAKKKADGQSTVAKIGFDVAARFLEITRSVVAHLNEGLRKEYEARAADGEISKDDAVALKAEAIRLIKEAAGPALVKQLQDFVGGGDISIYLSGLVERVLTEYQAASNMKALANP